MLQRGQRGIKGQPGRRKGQVVVLCLSVLAALWCCKVDTYTEVRKGCHLRDIKQLFSSGEGSAGAAGLVLYATLVRKCCRQFRKKQRDLGEV